MPGGRYQDRVKRSVPNGQGLGPASEGADVRALTFEHRTHRVIGFDGGHRGAQAQKEPRPQSGSRTHFEHLATGQITEEFTRFQWRCGPVTVVEFGDGAELESTPVVGHLALTGPRS